MSQHLYAGAATANAGSRAASGGPNGGSADGGARGPQPEDVIDVEFEEKR